MARHTKAEAARLLGISRTTLYRLIEQGKVSPTAEGMIDDAELVRAAPYVDTIKARIETFSDSDQGRHETTRDSAQGRQGIASIQAIVDTELQDHGQRVTHDDNVQERHNTDVTGRHWTGEGIRYRTHLEGAVDTLRAQVHALQSQVEALHDDLRAVRIARDHAEEEARTERIRYVQMLQEFYQRYDRLLEAPRSLPVLSTSRGPQGNAPVSAPQRDRGDMRQRIVALLHDYPDGLSPMQTRQLLGVDKKLGDTMKAMMREGLLRRVALGQYTAID